jgi:hypothetical protein
MTTILVTLISLLTLGLPAVFSQPAPTTPVPELTAGEIADLEYMREEEKLAHDVYVALYDLWGVPVFNNIAAAETTHTSAVLRLLNRYGIADPVAGNPAGVFANADLQALYDELVAQGSLSAADAYYVGATIEEVDIADLQKSIAASRQADITAVYNSLLRGSSNHLRAFVGQWERTTGQTYQPQVLDQATYAAIIGGSTGGGRGNSNGRWGRSANPGGPRFGRVQP